MSRAHFSSWPGLSRPSTSYFCRAKNVDHRNIGAKQRRPSDYGEDDTATLGGGTSAKPVKDATARGRTIDAGHPVRQRLSGIAGLHGSNFCARGGGVLDFNTRLEEQHTSEPRSRP